MTPEEIKKLQDDLAATQAALNQAIADKDKAVADKNKILNEKKDLMELFSKDDKEGMTDTEKKLAEEAEALNRKLAEERSSREKLEKSIQEEAEARNKSENDRIQKGLDQRIAKVAKGDKAVEDKLRANVALLEKMPRQTDSDLDAVINASYNMLGNPDSNPLNAINSISGGEAQIADKAAFSSTAEGKNLAGKLGLNAVANEGKDTGKEPAKAEPTK